MLADTDAIRALGAVSAGHADDLSAAAAKLLSVTGPATAAAFGPVAGGYLTALAEAAARESESIASLSARVLGAEAAAIASAAAYDDAEDRVGNLLASPTLHAGA